MKTVRLRFTAPALLWLIALGAMACGGGSEDAVVTSAGTGTPTAPPANAATPRVVTIPSAPTSQAGSAPSPSAPISQAGSAPSPVPTKATEPVIAGRSEDDELAPDFRNITSWINSEPFTIESQRGKVVLIDFWTYTCVNCIRTLPYIKEWHEKYADSGLVIVGVHTPEFDFEKDRENVLDAVEEFEIEYAVAQDNDFGTWRNFNNRYWPAKYLIDKDGYIRYNHFGEGAYDETESVIRELLEEAGADLSQISAVSAPEPERDTNAFVTDSTTGLTRELYAGYERNYGVLQSQANPPYILHPEYYEAPNAEVLYSDPGGHRNQFLYLHGLWRNEAERLVHARQTEGFEDYVALKFFATSVNVVMGRESSESYTVRVTIDDGPLTMEQAGVDVRFDDDGESYVLVDESRMYNLLNLSEFGGSELKLSSVSDDFAIFAFTFGAYMGGEPSSS